MLWLVKVIIAVSAVLCFMSTKKALYVHFTLFGSVESLAFLTPVVATDSGSLSIFLSDPLSVRILYSSLPFSPLDLRLNGELLYIHACIHIHEISACLHEEDIS